LKDENKTKAELIKELKLLRKEREKEGLKNIFEYKEAEKRAKVLEKEYQKIFENMMDGLVLHKLINDKNGHPVDYVLEKVNKAAERILSWKRKDIEGKRATEVYNGDTPFIERYAKIAQTGKAEYFVDYYPRFKRWYEIRSFCPKKGYFANIFRDITERKQAEKKIKHLNLVLRAIRSVNQIMVKEKNRERLLKGVCNNLIGTQSYYNAWIALLDESGKLETYAEAGIGKAFLPIVEMLKKGELTVCGQKALKQQGVVTIKDPISTCLECPLIKQYSGRSAMTIRLEYNGKIYGLMSVSILVHLADNQEEQSLFKEVAEDIAFSIHNIELDEERIQAGQELQKTHQRLKKTMNAAIDAMSKIIEAKDPYTSGHQQRVSQLTTAIAKELDLSSDKIEGIRITSLIHDIGKIGLPTEILSKPTKLTDIEFNLIKGHSQIGYDILKSIEFSWPIAKIVLQHHERLNGSGYPQGLKGEDIIIEARILGVADVVEAMSSHRPYRPALGIDAALEEISKNKGILYDPEVVDVCLKLFKEKGFKFE
jgi:PAS domain S-box-containing protein